MICVVLLIVQCLIIWSPEWLVKWWIKTNHARKVFKKGNVMEDIYCPESDKKDNKIKALAEKTLTYLGDYQLLLKIQERKLENVTNLLTEKSDNVLGKEELKSIQHEIKTLKKSEREKIEEHLQEIKKLADAVILVEDDEETFKNNIKDVKESEGSNNKKK